MIFYMNGNLSKLYNITNWITTMAQSFWYFYKKEQKMTVEDLHELHDSLKALSVEERMEKYQLKPDRADVIVPAGEIFTTIADIIHASYVYVPVIGLSDGIIDGLYAHHLEEEKAALGGNWMRVGLPVPNLFWKDKISCSRLKIYISSLEIHIFNLKMHIFRLKTEMPATFLSFCIRNFRSVLPGASSFFVCPRISPYHKITYLCRSFSFTSNTTKKKGKHCG